MCQRCVDAIKKHLPKLKESELGEFALNFTPLPFGSVRNVEVLVKEYARNTDGTLASIADYVAKQMQDIET